MNETESYIVNELLNSIKCACVEDRADRILCYREFLEAVNLRMCVEAQRIENTLNRKD